MNGTGSDDRDAEAAPTRKRRPHRRVTTAPPPGSDPHPEPEPERIGPRDNDERMRREKPPHY